MKDEHLAKHKSLSINLASYVEVCTENNITNHGLQCLLFYRDKYKQYKLSIDFCNMVLGGFAEKANLAKMTEVLGILKTDNIECNAQLYAAIFECLARLDENEDISKLLRKYQEEATKNVTKKIWNFESTSGDVLIDLRFVSPVGCFIEWHSQRQCLHWQLMGNCGQNDSMNRFRISTRLHAARMKVQ